MPTNTLKSAAEIVTVIAPPQPDRSDVRSRLEDVPGHIIGLHTRFTVLQQLVTEAEQKLIQSFVIASGGGDRHYGNAAGPARQFCEADFVQTYIDRREVLALVAQSEELKAAQAIMLPLLSELAELEAKEDAARVARGEKENALREARETAKARAIEAAENDPAVIAARKKLESLS